MQKRRLLRSSISTYGTIQPRTQTTLIAEVPGIIEKVAPIEKEGPQTTRFPARWFFPKKAIYSSKIEDVGLITLEAEARPIFAE